MGLLITSNTEFAVQEISQKPAVHNWKISTFEDGKLKIDLDAASSDVLKTMSKHLLKGIMWLKMERI